jgi:N utilization substance protein B
MSTKKPLPLSVLRHNARRKLVQALYQWDQNRISVTDLHAQFLTHDTRDRADGFSDPMRAVDKAYFGEVLEGILARPGALDEQLTPVMSRSVESLTPVERSVLRLAVFELMHRPDIQYRVVINEAIELVKEFGAQDSHRFVNGVLDRLAPGLRPHEPRAQRRR